MKTTLILACLALASCSAPTEWADTPNPLDTPATEYRTSESEGHFGHGWMIR
jgi:hypothetical protein